MEKKKEFYVVAYDVKSNRRRSRVAKLLEKCGARVNYSVFECMLTLGQLKLLRSKITVLINEKQDSVIFYPCCLNCYYKIEYIPAKKERKPSPMVIVG